MTCYVFYKEGLPSVHHTWPSSRGRDILCYAYNFDVRESKRWGIPDGATGWADIDEKDVPPEIKTQLLLLG